MFEKGDYIVITRLDNVTVDSFSVNYLYKQREDQVFIRPEKDNRNSSGNGLPCLRFDKNPEGIKRGDWRYATDLEIERYNELGKPYDVIKNQLITKVIINSLDEMILNYNE